MSSDFTCILDIGKHQSKGERGGEGEGGRKKEEETKEKEWENPEVVLFQSTEYLGFQGGNPTSQPK